MSTSKTKKAKLPEAALADRVAELLKRGESFVHSRFVNTNWGFSKFKPSSAAAVGKRLKDSALYVSQVEVHPHDHPLGVDWELLPGDVLVEVEFCRANSASKIPISDFRWFVPAEEPTSD